LEMTVSERVASYCDRLRSMSLVGAMAGAGELCRALAEEYALAGDEALGALRNDVAFAAEAIESVKPATAIYEVALDLLRRATASPRPVAATVGVAYAIAEWIRSSSARVAEGSAELLRDSRALLVYDYSSTLLGSIRHAADVAGPFELIVVPECRITGLGWRVADLLAPCCAQVRVIADCAVHGAIAQVDAVLLGAEAITPSGALVNTMGSMLIALAAADRGVGCHVLSSALKLDTALAGTRLTTMLSRRRAGGFTTATTTAPVEVASELLELTPPELLSGYVMEAGQVAPGDALAAYETQIEVLRTLVESQAGGPQ
jgi:ribose 1,5-bisphosphate isomerase